MLALLKKIFTSHLKQESDIWFCEHCHSKNFNWIAEGWLGQHCFCNDCKRTFYVDD